MVACSRATIDLTRTERNHNDMQSDLEGVPLYFSYHHGGLRSLGRWLYYVAVWLLVFLSLVLLALQYGAFPASKATFIFGNRLGGELPERKHLLVIESGRPVELLEEGDAGRDNPLHTPSTHASHRNEVGGVFGKRTQLVFATQ